MADDTGGQNPPLPRNISVRRLNVDQSTMRDVTVERFNASTGESLDAQSDLLTEVWDAIDEQTKTLKDALAAVENEVSMISKDLQKAVKESNKGAAAEVAKILANTGGGGLSKADMDRLVAAIGKGGGGGGDSGSSGGGSGGTNKLTEAIDSLRRTMETSATQAAVEGGDGGGGSPGRDFVDVRAAEVQIEQYREIIKRTATIFENTMEKRVENLKEHGSVFSALTDQYYSLVRSGVLTTIRENFQRVAYRVQQFGESITEFSNITKFATEKFQTYMNLSTTGLADFQDVFFGDLIPALALGRDNLTSTFETINMAVQENLANPLGIMGQSIHEVAETLHDVRRVGVESFGYDFFDRMGFQEANEAMVSLLDIERRANLNADIRDGAEQQRMVSQLRFLDLISQNTGQTVQELIKANRQNLQEIASLEGLSLSRGQRRGFERMIMLLQGQGLDTMAQAMMEVARSGGIAEAAFANNTDLTRGLAASGNIDAFRAMVDLANRGGSLDDMTFGQAVNDIGRSFGRRFVGAAGRNAGVVGETSNMISEMGKLRESLVEARESNENTIAGAYNELVDIFTNYLPSSTMMMVAALGANTAALVVNTYALYKNAALGGMGGGGPGRIRRAIGGIGRGIGAASGAAMAGGRRAIGGIGRGIGAASGAAMAGGRALARGTMGLGKMAIKKLPIIGLGAGLLFGAQRAMAGDFAGAGMEVASGAASMVPGVGTAASMAIDGGLMARDMGAFGGGAMAGPGRSEIAAPTPSSGGTSRAERMAEDQMSVLRDIKMLLEDANDLNSDIRRNTQRIGAGSPGIIGSIGDAISEGFRSFSGDDKGS